MRASLKNVSDLLGSDLNSERVVMEVLAQMT